METGATRPFPSSDTALRITKVIPVHPKEDMNVTIKFHSNPFGRKSAISAKTEVHLSMALEENDRGSTSSAVFIPCAPSTSIQNVLSTHLSDTEIFPRTSNNFTCCWAKWKTEISPVWLSGCFCCKLSEPLRTVLCGCEILVPILFSSSTRRHQKDCDDSQEPPWCRTDSTSACTPVTSLYLWAVFASEPHPCVADEIRSHRSSLKTVVRTHTSPPTEKSKVGFNDCVGDVMCPQSGHIKQSSRRLQLLRWDWICCGRRRRRDFLHQAAKVFSDCDASRKRLDEEMQEKGEEDEVEGSGEIT